MSGAAVEAYLNLNYDNFSTGLTDAGSLAESFSSSIDTLFSNIETRFDDLSSKIDELLSPLSEFESQNIEIQVDTSSVGDATEDLENVREIVHNINIEDNNITYDFRVEGDDQVFSTIEEAEARMTELNNSMGNMNGIETLNNEIDNLDSSNVDSLINSIDGLTDTINNAGDAANNTSNDIDNLDVGTTALTGAVAGVAGVGLANEIYGWSEAAGNYSDSMGMLEIASDNVGISLESSKKIASNLTQTLGVSGSSMRSFIGTLELYNVTNQNTISGLAQSAKGLAYLGKSTGATFESVSQGIQKSIGQGTISVRTFGQQGFGLVKTAIESSGQSFDEFKSKYENATQPERAEMLNNVLSNTPAIMEASKKASSSYEAQQQRLSNSTAGLTRRLGELVMPTLITFFTLVTGILNNVIGGFDSLSPPVKSFFGVLATGAGIIATFILGLSALRSAYALLGISDTIRLLSQFNLTNIRATLGVISQTLGLTTNTGAVIANNAAKTGAIGEAAAHAGALGFETGAESTGIMARIRSTGSLVTNSAAKVYNAVQSRVLAGATIITSGATTAYTAIQNSSTLASIRAGIAYVAQKGAMVAGTTATYIATAAQWLWNAALDANPIGIVIMAIAGLIAILMYLYNNNETVRNGINSLWQVLSQLGGFIQGVLLQAWNSLNNALNSIWNTINSNPILSFIVQLLTITNPILFIVTHFGLLQNVLTSIYNYLSGGFTESWNILSQTFQTVGTILSFIFNIFNLFINIFTRVITGQISLQQAFQMSWSIIWSIISSIGAMILGYILRWGSQLVTRAVSAGSRMVTGFINYIKTLPSRFWSYLSQALSKAGSFISQGVSKIGNGANSMLNRFKSGISGMPGAMASEMMHIVNNITSYASNLATAAYNAAKRAVSSFINALDSHSPGIIARTMAQEMKYTANSIMEGSKSIYYGARNAALAAIHGFGNPSLEASMELNRKINNESSNSNIGNITSNSGVSKSNTNSNGSTTFIQHNEFHGDISDKKGIDEKLKESEKRIIKLIGLPNPATG